LCRAQSILVLLLCLLAAWALWQRIDQHGLTQERILAAILVVIFLLYGVGYAVTALLPKQVRALQQVNVVMALVTMVVAVLLMTPVLDLPDMAAKQQIARLERGELLPEEVDLGWLRFEAGLAGVNALEHLKALPETKTDTMLTRFADLESSENMWDYQALLDGKEKRAELNTTANLTSVHIVRTTVGDADSDRAVDRLYNVLAAMPSFNQLCIEQALDCAIVETDLLKTGSRQYLVALRGSAGEVRIEWFVEAVDNSWTIYKSGMIWDAFSSATFASQEEIDGFFQHLKDGSPPMVPVTLPALLIGDQQLVPGMPAPYLNFR
jgi:hypothetical protein